MVHMVSVKVFMSPGFGGEYDRLRVLCMRSSRSFLTVREGREVTGLSHHAQLGDTTLRSVPCMLNCSNQLLLLVFHPVF